MISLVGIKPLRHANYVWNRHYIALAREKRPVVPPEVSAYVVDSYVRLRKKSKQDEAEGKSQGYTSARTLLGVLRLAQALARLRFSDVVDPADVDEALRMMEVSKDTLDDDDEDKDKNEDRTYVSKIFRLVKTMASSGQGRRKKSKRLGKGPNRERDMDVDSDDEDNLQDISIVDIRSRILGQSFTEDQLNETISQYEELGIWMKVSNATKLRFIDGGEE